jgi:hypothetical protein
MVPGGIFTVNVEEHEHDGERFEQLKVKDLEALADNFEENSDEYVKVEKG